MITSAVQQVNRHKEFRGLGASRGGKGARAGLQLDWQRLEKERVSVPGAAGRQQPGHHHL